MTDDILTKKFETALRLVVAASELVAISLELVVTALGLILTGVDR